MKATYYKHTLNFKRPSGTSRGVLKTKDTWILTIEDNQNSGIGECGMFKGLSYDDNPDYEQRLQWACDNINMGLDFLLSQLKDYPSINIGLEMAFQSLKMPQTDLYFPSKFTDAQEGIPINGLIWMGDVDFMKSQIRNKIDNGFTCIKLKIGAIDFEAEMQLLNSIRKEYSMDDIELRVDANGAFSPDTALEKLERLSKLNIHSIEQPIKQGQLQAMADLCQKSPLPIALDEELIGITEYSNKKELLKTINPHFIILKPTLVGGFMESEQWINLAEQQHIGWWITSALESNIGLNAIAQWTYNLKNSMPQGLGTGGLFTNNFETPLIVKSGTLQYQN